MWWPAKTTMGGDVLLGAFLAIAILSLLANLRRERRNFHDPDSPEAAVPRPTYVTIVLIFVVGLCPWLASNALIAPFGAL